MENVVKEESKNKNLIIGVLVFVIVLLSVALVYFVFIKKDKTEEPTKPQDNQQVENNTKDEYGLSGKSFKTKDDKITLKIVDKTDKKAYDDAKNVYYEEFDGKRSYNNDRVIYYGYLNNDVIEIKSIKKVDYYLILDTELPFVSNILVNTNTNIIEEDESRFSLSDYDRFLGDTGFQKYDLIKVNNGYFITSYEPSSEDPFYTIFTTQWKKIGYYNDYNLKYENDGIYVFDNDKFTGSLIKYDINGNKIS